MRRTCRTLAVAAALLDDPQGRHWGYPLAKKAGVPSGVLYPILARMLDEGWLTDDWEEGAQAAAEGRPARRYYELTPRGVVALGAMLEGANVQEHAATVAAGGAA